MKLNKTTLREMIMQELLRSSRRGLVESHLLREQEPDEEDAEADDLLGDEGDDEAEEKPKGGGKKTTPTGGGDSAAPDDEEDDSDAADDEEEPESEEEEPEEPPEPSGPTGFEFDEEINLAMRDFEEKALDVASAKREGRIPSITRFLFEVEDEEDEVQIDMDTFAGDVARLISNYDSLIDMEQAIFTKAQDFLTDKYGEEAADQLEDILAMKHDIHFDHEYDPEIPDREVYAVGAAGEGGGGA